MNKGLESLSDFAECLLDCNKILLLYRWFMRRLIAKQGIPILRNHLLEPTNRLKAWDQILRHVAVYRPRIKGVDAIGENRRVENLSCELDDHWLKEGEQPREAVVRAIDALAKVSS
jgi:hypothetical protein